METRNPFAFKSLKSNVLYVFLCLILIDFQFKMRELHDRDIQEVRVWSYSYLHLPVLTIEAYFVIEFGLKLHLK